jgi:hypothetical protein
LISATLKALPPDAAKLCVAVINSFLNEVHIAVVVPAMVQPFLGAKENGPPVTGSLVSSGVDVSG